MGRGAGCREANLRLRRREKNALDIPFYRPGQQPCSSQKSTVVSRNRCDRLPLIHKPASFITCLRSACHNPVAELGRLVPFQKTYFGLPCDGPDGCTSSRPCQHPDPADLCPAPRREHQSIDRSHGHRPQPARGAAFHQLTLPTSRKNLRPELMRRREIFITFLSQQPDFGPRSHSEIGPPHL